MTLIPEYIKRMVTEQRLAYIATISPDGWPRVSPKGSVRVWGDDHLVWVDIDSANTIRNLEANPRTEVNVVDPYIRKGYRFSGTGTVLRSGPSYSKAVEMYRAEGADIGRIRAVAFVKVEGLAPLVSPAYALGLTEREVGRLWEEYYTKSFQKTVKDLIPPQEF